MPKAFKLGVLALALGTLLNLLFYKQGIGLNLPLASLAFIGATYLAMHIGGHQLPYRAHIAAIFSFLFALPFAIGTSEQMLVLGTFGFLAAHLLFAAFTLGHAAHFNHPLEIFWSGTAALSYKLLGRLDFFGKMKPPALSQTHWAVAKGLLALIPLLIIFIALFASADPVFNSYFGNLGTWLNTWTQPEDIVTQLFLICLAFIGISLFFGAAAYERYVHELKPDRQPAWILESKVILIGLTILFALFLGLQASVMFGGSAAFETLDLTYAQYAREGFNQLIFAGVLVALVILTLRDQHGVKTDKVLTALHVLLIIETLLVLVSASLRLNLYIDTYGFTDDRLLAYWTIITIGIMLALLLANVILRESQRSLMNRALVILGICALIFCYSMPEALATRLNLNRAQTKTGLVAGDIAGLSPEAIPVIAQGLTDSLSPMPAVEDYCRAFSGIATFSGALSTEQKSDLKTDYHSRLAAKNWLSRDSVLSQQQQDSFDWRDWNYSKVRANDILPLNVPEQLNIPDVGDNSPACAPFLPLEPAGLDPKERKR